MTIRNFADIKSLFLDNITTKQTIFKNSVWLTVSSGVDRVLRLALLIYVARILGATEYGKFTFALAFISLFTVFYDFGLPSIITREFAREGDKEKEFHSLVSLKILLSLGALILIFLSSFFITQDPGIQKIILILALFSLTESFIAIFYSFFYAFQRMEYRAWLEIIQAILIVGISFFVLFNFPSVENLSYSYLTAGLLALFLALVFFRLKFPPLKISWQKSVWQRFLTMSWPLALAGLFDVLYHYIDSVMLGYSGQITQTGWYNAAFRIINVAIVPGALISKSFYPVLSKLFKESKEGLQKVWDNQMELMILLTTPLVIGGIVLAPRIIEVIYGEGFLPSVLALQILIITAGIISLCRPFCDVMISSNQQKKLLGISISAAIVNIVLNLILIPKYSLYGAAVATVITYILIISMFFGYTKRFTPVSPFQLNFLFTFFLAAISSFLMCLVLKQPLVYNLNIFLSLIIGTITYFLSFFGLRYVLKLLGLHGFSK